MGDTATDTPWKEMDKVLDETWQSANGNEIQLRMLTVDSGYNTNHVYSWIRSKSPDRVRAIKGSDSLQMSFGQPRDIDIRKDGARLTRAVKVWAVGVSVIKSELYSWLKLDSAGDDGKHLPGFCHFPQYDEDYFKRLCSEQLVQKLVNGRTVHRWIKIHERNEPLDCRVYARAAAAMFGMDRFRDTDWDALEGKFELPKPKPVTKQVPVPQQPPPAKNENSYLSRQQRKGFKL
jgi:phage terminase large subunit GpA-like protein